MSSTSFIYDPDGIDSEKLDWVRDLKNRRRGRIGEYTERYGRATFRACRPRQDVNALWDIPAACAFPSATQHEVSAKDAANLVNNGGSSWPRVRVCRRLPTAQGSFGSRHPLRSQPGSNAGGVSVSGFEMAQDSQRLQWSRDEVDEQLRAIMGVIHSQVRDAAEQYGQPGNYVLGANIAGFRKVADTMLDESIV